ncbi:hypothetical protein [Zymobacter sp. IVIA_5232.4 C2]|uniref:hypothetical protein n=1 Tax=Zymobacter sp. IVIA_5232.4 C2 TaxID=3394855 RepID=UPI0039C0E473
MKKIILLFISIFFIPTTVHAKECTQSILDEADKNAGDFKSWKNVYEYSEKYGECIGSDTQESVSEGVVRILADDWEQLHTLKILINKDKKFERFIIDNISSTVLEDDLLKIQDLAKKQCPSDSSRLCKKISNKAIKAYKEINDIN